VASVCIHIRAPTEAVQALHSAQALCRKLKDRKKEAAVLSMSVNAHLLTGDVEDALRAARDARAICQETRDRRAEAEVLEIVAQVHLAQGETGEALEAARAMAQLLEQLGEQAPVARARQMIAELHAQRGDLDGALRAAKEALAQSQAAGEKTAEAEALHLVAQAHMMRHQQAVEGLASEADYARLPQEDPREAVQAATRARTLFRQAGEAAKEAEVLHTAAQAHLARGNHREATRCAEEQLFLARKAKDKLAEANAQLLCTAMYAEQDRLTPAMRAATAAKELFQELGHDEGLQNAEWYLEWFTQVAEERAAQQRAQQQRGRGYPNDWGVRAFGEAASFDASGRPVREGRQAAQREARGVMGGSGGSGQIYNRKAFPWTAQQGTAGK